MSSLALKIILISYEITATSANAPIPEIRYKRLIGISIVVNYGQHKIIKLETGGHLNTLTDKISRPPVELIVSSP
jgi:hypothetical protein